ncbi:MAG: type I CRISPR-associated protein Cas7 [Leptospiraceae bacterium]|nr:type I CRISPR-associated protein Cas7 [Leptospiraceae bacterium]
MTDNKKASFENRVFGCVIVKSINSNYNADFTHQPRTLPDGTVYATDKALKYTIRNYIDRVYTEEKVFYFKRLNEDLNPLDLVGMYKRVFNSEIKSDSKDKLLINLLSCIDIKLFGATFAPKGNDQKGKNISIHGPVQINHGVNRFPENSIYSEQIMSPFSNPKEKKGKDNEESESSEPGMTTLGSQSKLKEGHYVHHFSINPLNLRDHSEIANKGKKESETVFLSNLDIEKLKEGMKKGATYYDSASKAGTENELLLWIQLKKESKAVLPNLSELVEVERKESGQVKIDLSKIKEVLESRKDEIEKIEVSYNSSITELIGLPDNSVISEL